MKNMSEKMNRWDGGYACNSVLRAADITFNSLVPRDSRRVLSI